MDLNKPKCRANQPWQNNFAWICRIKTLLFKFFPGDDCSLPFYLNEFFSTTQISVLILCTFHTVTLTILFLLIDENKCLSVRCHLFYFNIYYIRFSICDTLPWYWSFTINNTDTKLEMEKKKNLFYYKYATKAKGDHYLFISSLESPYFVVVPTFSFVLSLCFAEIFFKISPFL